MKVIHPYKMLPYYNEYEREMNDKLPMFSNDFESVYFDSEFTETAEIIDYSRIIVFGDAKSVQRIVNDIKRRFNVVKIENTGNEGLGPLLIKHTVVVTVI